MHYLATLDDLRSIRKGNYVIRPIKQSNNQLINQSNQSSNQVITNYPQLKIIRNTKQDDLRRDDMTS